MDNQSNIQHLITGTGRSGTTFLAHVLYNAGLDFGDSSPVSIGAVGDPIGGGMELATFAHLNTKLMYDMNHFPLKEVIESNSESMQEQWPQYMKDPRYLITWPIWEKIGIRPRHIFFCTRIPESTNQSINQTTNWNIENPSVLYMHFYKCLLYVLEKDISHTFVHYPRIAKDKEYAEKTLGAFIKDPWPIIQQTWDDSLHHFKSE
ncbi:hypothetical protein COU75_03510 [Candidatus Peregrinibacteria bacterium CG10_big_fil_rev_8_21_14_0_10_42_8]|nr:MAG: hypothetical protein COU75_03510 [Candidatus Peregrinibacteria bacterium CG10_big_fil_rev_8_21_14_0_10_42_8]